MNVEREIVNGRRYGKLDGMCRAMDELPNLCPWVRIDVIDSLRDFDKVADQYDDFAVLRVDISIGSRALLQDVNTRGFANREDIAKILKIIKGKSPEAMVLIAQTKNKPIERYLDDGGFSVGIFGDGTSGQIIVELVGKGFDGHEVTRAVAIHERLVIPYDQRHVYALKSGVILEDFQHTCIDQDRYTRTREQRIKMLTEGLSNTTGLDVKTVEAAIPEKYEALLGSPMLMELLSEIGRRLYDGPEILGPNGNRATSMSLQGNFIKNKAEVWGFFLPEYWL